MTDPSAQITNNIVADSKSQQEEVAPKEQTKPKIKVTQIGNFIIGKPFI